MQLLDLSESEKEAAPPESKRLVDLASPELRLTAAKPQDGPDKVVPAETKAPEKFTAPMGSPALQEWTVAINIGCHKGGLKEATDDKMKMLEELAGTTKGKPITFLVQRVMPPADPLEGQAKDEKPPATVEKYLIRDGEIKKLSTGKSRGLVEDAGSLLEDAAKNHSSKKLSYFMLCHGMGNGGLAGDSGKCRVPELGKNFRRHLDNSGKKEIDLLNLDGCLMAQDGVLPSLQLVADRLVASTEYQCVARPATIFSGQNEKAYLAKLIDNPAISGEQLGKLIIDEAKKGSNDAPSDKLEGRNDTFARTGTPSLSLLNLKTAQTPFTESLNNFGNALSEALNDQKNRKTVDSLIDLTPRFGSDGYDSGAGAFQKRDVKSFAELVLEAVDKRTITDPDGSLKRATQSLIETRSKLVEAHHGYHGPIDQSHNARNHDYDHTGGISVFLPGQLFRSPEDASMTMTHIGRLIKWGQAPNLTKALTVGLIEQKGREAAESLPPSEQDSLKPLAAAIVKLKAAESGSDLAFQTQVQAVLKEARAVENLPWNKNDSKKYTSFYKEQLEKAWTEETLPGTSSPGWIGFVNKLKK